eukprot:756283-Hanusia_phi.AAC.3
MVGLHAHCSSMRNNEQESGDDGAGERDEASGSRRYEGEGNGARSSEGRTGRGGEQNLVYESCRSGRAVGGL